MPLAAEGWPPTTMISAKTVWKLLSTGCLAVLASAQSAPWAPSPKPEWSTPSHESKKQALVALLTQKKYAEAARQAAELNRQVPDDIDVYGYLAEAQIELGQLAAAEENVDWMFRLRQPRVESLLLGARLRDQFGDVDGALDFCGQAFRQLAGPTDPRFERVLLVTIGIEVRRDRLALAEAHLQMLRPGLVRDEAEALVAARRNRPVAPSRNP